MNLEGALTWAFEFEDQPYFAGFRALATQRHRPAGAQRLPHVRQDERPARGRREHGRRVPLDAILKDGVRGDAGRRRRWPASTASKLARAWPGTTTTTTCRAPTPRSTLALSGLPRRDGEARAHALPHRRDAQQRLRGLEADGLADRAQRSSSTRELEAAGKLAGWRPRPRVRVDKGQATLPLALPRQAVSLVVLEW